MTSGGNFVWRAASLSSVSDSMIFAIKPPRKAGIWDDGVLEGCGSEMLLLMLYSIFSYAFLVPAALCCQLTLTRLLTSRYDACVILRRSRTIWRYDHSSRFFTDSIVSFDERFRAGLVP